VLKERRKKKAPDLQSVDVETRKYSPNAVLESLIKIGITRLGKLTAILNQGERQSYPLPPIFFNIYLDGVFHSLLSTGNVLH
jgi:hypothetical protein